MIEFCIKYERKSEIPKLKRIQKWIVEKSSTMKKMNDKDKKLKEEVSPQGQVPEDQIKFDLADDKKEYVNLDMKDENLGHLGNFLQKLHLKNHIVSSKETIHELYRPEEEVVENENLLSQEDELLFAEIQQAVEEHDIITLRSNLQFIAKNTSAHDYSFEELEEFVEGDLEEMTASSIQRELLTNSNLKDDVNLFREINEALAEKDVIQLRSNLSRICENESSHTRSIEEIENYLSEELEENERQAFEEEMLINTDLMKDVKICNEINEAIGEKDIMALRKNLGKIKDTEIRDDVQKRGITAPRIQKAVWVAAASIVLLMGLSITFRENSLSNAQLYHQFYQPFESGIGINRSATPSGESLVNKAILKMNEKDYDSALSLFAEVLKTDKYNVIGNFYTGAIQQKKGEYDAAISSFSNVIRQGDNLFVEQSQWYIGLCYLNRNEREKAIRQFKKIVEQKGYYQKESEAILKKLE